MSDKIEVGKAILLLDIGNTRIKAGVARGAKEAAACNNVAGEPERAACDNIAGEPEILCTERFETIGALIDWANGFGAFERAIFSSTRDLEEGERELLHGAFAETVELSGTTKLPIKNLYRSPETLGTDRLAAAVGAWKRFGGKDILVVDFGSALTIDFVNGAGEFLGGNISPGASMRLRTLHEFTSRLPLVTLEEGISNAERKNELILEIASKEEIFGGSTSEAIWNGVARGIDFEVAGYVNSLRDNNILKCDRVGDARTENDLVVLFTGGDAEYFANRQKFPIFVCPDLVLEGLHYITEGLKG